MVAEYCCSHPRASFSLGVEVNVAAIRELMQSVEFMDWTFLVRQDSPTVRPYMQVEATTLCNMGGEPFTWKGRKWFLSDYMTKSEIIQTAFLAVQTAMEHEVRERFLYKGKSIFDPHYDVDALFELRSRADCQDARDQVAQPWLRRWSVKRWLGWTALNFMIVGGVFMGWIGP